MANTTGSGCIAQAVTNVAIFAVPGLEQHPAVLAASRERDRPGQRPADLAQALHGAPDPGGRDRQLLAPLPLDQLGQRELLGAEQRLPVLRRPVLDRSRRRSRRGPLPPRPASRRRRARRRSAMPSSAISGLPSRGAVTAVGRVQHPAHRRRFVCLRLASRPSAPRRPVRLDRAPHRLRR